jgi:predicted dinucleotide-binding enzyme
MGGEGRVAQEVIAILGGGSVGSHLGTRFKAAGLDVRFGVRSPEKPAARAIAAITVPAAVEGATVVFLAVPAAAAVEAARSLGLHPGAVLVDCTNPIRWDHGPVWNPPPEGSVTAALSAVLPQVPVVKGFNHFGAEIHENPQLPDGPADALFAGDDVPAKARVMALAEQIGFKASDAGPLRNAALLENLTVLWIQLATTGVGRQFAFRVDRR